MPAASYLPYAATRRFSPLVLDYLEGRDATKDLYTFRPDAGGLLKAITERASYPVDRKTLVEVLGEQYRHLPLEQKVMDAISALGQEKTFTVCTAHQPNLATGYLYFVYKILHAIRLAEELKKAHPGYQFVPVYYMGSEDADLDELGTFRFGDKKFVWDAGGQGGAVGRMKTDTLKPLLEELFKLFPMATYTEELKHLLYEAYLNRETVSKATQYLVHALFGRYGLIVLDPDHTALKRSFVPVMAEDLILHSAENLVSNTIQKLSDAGYKAQAHPRTINLFYLKDSIRERIERDGDCWRVLNTNITWNRDALLIELGEFPERFSPNVMLRPLYQETILPNVAFIGGGAEVAYWLQLKSLFAHHKAFYPAIILRQSVMWVSSTASKLKAKTGLDYLQLFNSKDEAARDYISAVIKRDWSLGSEHDQMEVLLSEIREKATDIDPTLRQSADATLAKMKRQFEVLEHKILRALKRREEEALSQVARLQNTLFPGGGLAERVENFMSYYSVHGSAFFESLLQSIEPLRNEFLIVEQEETA